MDQLVIQARLTINSSCERAGSLEEHNWRMLFSELINYVQYCAQYRELESILMLSESDDG